jgi:hypothetical protein
LDEIIFGEMDLDNCPIEETKAEVEKAEPPVGDYAGSVDLTDWFFAPGERSEITSVTTNDVRIQVADDGTVTGSMTVIYEKECKA